MIGLCGAHRTGKTTLAKLVAEDTGMKYFAHNEAGNILREMNLSLDKNWSLTQRFDFQNRLLDAFEKALRVQSEPFISDRTPIDIAAYMFCDVQKAGKEMTGLDEKLEAFFHRAYSITNNYYSAVVHVPVAFPYVTEKGKPLPIISYQRQVGHLSAGMLLSSEMKSQVYYMEESCLSLVERLDYINYVFSNDNGNETMFTFLN